VLQPDNYGWRLENVIAIELLRRIDSTYQQLFYLRQNKSYEVDFVVVEQSKIKELIQVTYDFASPTTKLYNREVGGLVKGAKQTGCRQLTLIMMNGESRDIEVEGYTIKCIRAIDWLLDRE
jgi:predicted AAA+ superfamily ATPase